MRKPLVPSQPELIRWIIAISLHAGVLDTPKWFAFCDKYRWFLSHQTGGNLDWMRRARESALWGDH